MDIAVIVIGAILLVLLLWLIGTANRFRRLRVKIEESESGMDVALTRRYDMLTKMMEVCRQYAAHEVDTFEKIIRLRQGMSMAERRQASSQMDRVTEQLSVVAEGYPQLKSAEVYQQLQKGIHDAEAHLQAARRFYNANVSAFNQLLVSFPSSLIGRIQGQAAREFFEADAHKREDVTINL